MLILPDTRTIDAEKVISNGKVVAENGRLLTPPRRHTYQPHSLTTIQLPKRFSASDFIIRPPQKQQSPTLRIIELITDLVTAERQQEVAAVDGKIKCDPANDIITDPLLTRNTLTGVAIPYLRICEEGLVNLKDGKTVGLFAEASPSLPLRRPIR